MSNSNENVRFRKAKRKVNFTQIGNDMLSDPSLTLQAKGLLSIFVSNSEDWKINMKEIIKRSKNGRDAQYDYLNELIETGYVARVWIKTAEGSYDGMEYVFSDVKEEVEDELKDMRVWATENNKILVIEYCIKKPKKSKRKAKDKESKSTPSVSVSNEDTTVEPKQLDTDLLNNEFYRTAYEYFVGNGLSEQISIEVINHLHENNIQRFTYEDLDTQFKLCMKNYDSIYDFPKYFVNGIQRKIELRTVHDSIERSQSEENQKRSEHVKSIYYNWLEDEGTQ